MAWVQSMSTGTVVAGASAVAVCVAVLTAVSSKIRRKKRSAITEAFEEVAVEVDGKALDEGLSPAVDTDGKATYDFVIVGGGTAGCVLAARLSENPDFTVLLLEAGGSERHNQYHQIPLAFSELFHSKADWNFYTEKQDYADGKPRFWPRGKMLGGCSSINGMICHYGPPSDYDEWAKLAGDGGSGWAYDQFKKYFLKFEKFIPNMGYPGVDTSLRGTSGPVRVGFFTHRTNFSRKFLDACVNIGIPQNDDLNTIRGTLGVCQVRLSYHLSEDLTWTDESYIFASLQPMTFVDNKGTRISMETAYLTPEVLSRPNLTVLTHAQATRILFDLSGEEKRAIGVEFARNTEGREGTRFRVKARKEVVISAGAIHSPHLLLLSGIGPAADLATHQIPVVEDLPGVGSHLMDHTMVKTQIRIKEGEGLNYLNPRHEEGPIGKMRATRDFWRWKLGGRGPMASNMVETVAFLRSTDPNIFPSYAYPDQLEDSASSPLAPDIEAIGLPSAFIDHGLGEVPPGDVGCIFLINLRPTSLGRVWLKSADPFDAPLIDPKYLSTQHDITILTRGLHFLLRLSQTEPLSSWVGHNESDPRLDHHWNLDLSPSHQTSTNSNHFVNHYANTLPKLTSEVKLRTETVYHPTSTARMAPRDEGGVVDPELCVYGVKGLRICDASVFPTITASHTAAPVIATAEKAADLIKATY